MKIFVTGATGVIGRRVVPQLIQAGHQVTGLARTGQKAALLRRFGAAPVRVDLFDPTALVPVLAGHEAVANLATNVPPLERALEPTAWEMHNRLRDEASRSATRAAAEAGCRIFLQESITFPYADKGAEWIKETDADNCPPEMASSRVAEAQTTWFSGNGGQGIVLRFALFYAHDSSHTQEFQAAIRAGQSPFLGDPTSYMSHIHAEDAATAVVSALSAPAGIYNVADDQPLTRQELAAAIAELEGVASPAPPEPIQGDLPGSIEALTRSQRISNKRLKQTTGWAPRYPSVREGWRQILNS